MILDTGKDGYDIWTDLQTRTAEVLTEGPAHYLYERDLAPYPDEHPLVLWLHGQATGNVLDFGCGYGRLAPLVMETAESYHGVDVIPGRIEHARRMYGSDRVTFDVVTPESTTLGGPYDTVICVTVLQHLYLSYACDVLRRLRSVMRQGATLYLWDAQIFDADADLLAIKYAAPEAAEHMIPKPIALLKAAAAFDWMLVDCQRWKLVAVAPKRRRGRPRRNA